MKRIEELENRGFFNSPVPDYVSQLPPKAMNKYSIDPADYVDPRERLANEPRLESEAFKQNYVLEYSLGRVSYDAKDGINYTEPKFQLELWRWLRDPVTNEITNKKFRVHKVTFFEDPDAALQTAHAKGVNITMPEQDGFINPQHKAFLDEMRYLRFRDWLFEIFWPAPAVNKSAIREEVIGNRLVPVLETSSTEPLTNIPFDKL
jgi:hypothetical protein